MSLSPPSRARRLRAMAPLLALALLLAQTLGLMHRVLHGPGSTRGPAVAMQLHAAQAESVQAAPLSRLFGGHHDDSDCRVFDQLSHGDLLLAPVLLPAPVSAIAYSLPWVLGEAPCRPAVPFLARGPPVSR